jgi:hypothetical protein
MRKSAHGSVLRTSHARLAILPASQVIAWRSELVVATLENRSADAHAAAHLLAVAGDCDPIVAGALICFGSADDLLVRQACGRAIVVGRRRCTAIVLRDLDAWQQLVRQLGSAGELEAAAQALRTNPQFRIPHWFVVAGAFVEAGRRDAARDIVSEVVARFPEAYR